MRGVCTSTAFHRPGNLLAPGTSLKGLATDGVARSSITIGPHSSGGKGACPLVFNVKIICTAILPVPGLTV